MEARWIGQMEWMREIQPIMAKLGFIYDSGEGVGHRALGMAQQKGLISCRYHRANR
jgi:hypothetical protein